MRIDRGECALLTEQELPDKQMRQEFALHAPTYFLRTHSTGNGTSLTLSQKAKFDEERPHLLFNIAMDSFHLTFYKFQINNLQSS